MSDSIQEIEATWRKYGYKPPKEVRFPGKVRCEGRKECKFFIPDPEPGYCEILIRTYCRYSEKPCHFYKDKGEN